MLKKRLVQVLTIVVLAASLVCLFVPAVQDYDLTLSLWDRLRQAIAQNNTAELLTNGMYFIPPLVSLLLVLLLDSRFRYGVSLFSSSAVLTLLLSQFIFPALSQGYLFSVYQPGLYLLLLFTGLAFLLSMMGVCQRQTPEELLSLSATAELDLKKINDRLRRQREKEKKRAEKKQ